MQASVLLGLNEPSLFRQINWLKKDLDGLAKEWYDAWYRRELNLDSIYRRLGHKKTASEVFISISLYEWKESNALITSLQSKIAKLALGNIDQSYFEKWQRKAYSGIFIRLLNMQSIYNQYKEPHVREKLIAMRDLLPDIPKAWIDLILAYNVVITDRPVVVPVEPVHLIQQVNIEVAAEPTQPRPTRLLNSVRQLLRFAQRDLAMNGSLVDDRQTQLLKERVFDLFTEATQNNDYIAAAGLRCFMVQIENNAEMQSVRAMPYSAVAAEIILSNKSVVASIAHFGFDALVILLSLY